jgi:hypothetical protein
MVTLFRNSLNTRIVCFFSLLTLSVCAASADVITFENLPNAYFFAAGDQNIGTFYSGVTFGSNVTGLSVSRFGGYPSAAFPPHSGDVVIWDATDPTITIDFASAIGFVGIWYTSLDPLTLETFNASNTLLGAAEGTANTDGTTGADSFLSLSESGIQSLTISSSPGLFTLDDLTFQPTPEPSTRLLTAFAMVLLIFFPRALLAARNGKSVIASASGRLRQTIKSLVAVCFFFCLQLVLSLRARLQVRPHIP